MSPHRRDLLQLTALLGVLPLASAADTSVQLADSVVDSSHARLQSAAFGEVRTYFDGGTSQARSATAGSVRLKPGMEPHPPHRHIEDEFLIVAEGTGEISIEDQVTKAGSGDVAFFRGNKLHGIRNTGSVPMVFYFFKWRG